MLLAAAYFPHASGHQEVVTADGWVLPGWLAGVPHFGWRAACSGWQQCRWVQSGVQDHESEWSSLLPQWTLFLLFDWPIMIVSLLLPFIDIAGSEHSHVCPRLSHPKFMRLINEDTGCQSSNNFLIVFTCRLELLNSTHCICLSSLCPIQMATIHASTIKLAKQMSRRNKMGQENKRFLCHVWQPQRRPPNPNVTSLSGFLLYW